MSASATPRGLLYGAAAESYERFRLGYPDEVVDRTLAYAKRPVTEAVEIGAGTGKATRAFASHGITVTALEPDAEMFAVLRRETAGMPVRPVHTSFEEYAGPRTGLVYAAEAVHWTDPAARWRRAHASLSEGGVVAVFRSPMSLADARLQDDVDEAWSPLPAESLHEPEPDPGLAACELFTDVEHHRLERTVVVESRECVGYLSMLPAFLELPIDQRQEVARRVAAVLPVQVRVDVSVRLSLGRRA